MCSGNQRVDKRRGSLNIFLQTSKNDESWPLVLNEMEKNIDRNGRDNFFLVRDKFFEFTWEFPLKNKIS